MDPNDWRKYLKTSNRGGTSLSGGLSFGSDENGLATAAYLADTFDDPSGGGGLSPQQELGAQQAAIRAGGVLSSPETDVTRFATQAPDGSNYLDPKPAEIPPYLARNISPDMISAKPVAQPASGVISPELLVQRQSNPDGTRGSNVANAPPKRESFRKNEEIAKFLEDRAAKDLQSGMGSWFKNNVRSSALQDVQLAQHYRSRDEAEWNAATKQYYMSRPEEFDAWQRREQIRQGKLEQFAAANFVDAGGNVVQGGQFGGVRRLPGVNTQGMRENQQVDERMAKDDARKAEAERLARESKEKGWGVEERIATMKVGADNNSTDVQRQKLLFQQKVVGARTMNEKELRAAEAAGGRAGTPKFDLAAAAMGFIPVPVGDPPDQRIKYVFQADMEDKAAPGGKAPAAPAGGAVEWKRDANGKPIPAGR